MSELRLERRFAAAPSKVFAFVTVTENLVKWWGPEGMRVAEQAIDLTRTGPWSFTLLDPKGNTHRMSGNVLAVSPPRFVEFTMNVPGAGHSDDSAVRFEIEPDGAGGTLFTLIQSGISDEMVAMGRRGWGSTLDRLERLLAA